MTKRDNQSTHRHGVLSQMPHPESTVRQDVKPGSPHVDCIRIPTQVGHPCYPSVVLPAVDVDRLSGFPPGRCIHKGCCRCLQFTQGEQGDGLVFVTRDLSRAVSI